MVPYLALIATTWISSFLSKGNVLRYILFISVNVVIVGFRYEMGFDWPVYSAQFYELKELPLSLFLTQLPSLSVLYAHEPFYLVLAYTGAIIFPEFEYFQLFVYLFFLYSIYRLGKSIGCNNIIGALVPIHLFLLFTLEFSTYRQSLAISFFNIWLATVFSTGKRYSVVYLAAAIFTQVSSVVYFLAYAWTVTTRKWGKLSLILSTVAVIIVFSGGTSIIPTGYLPGFIGQKLNYYVLLRNYQYNITEQVFFLVFFVGLIIFFLKPSIREFTRNQAHFKLIVYLCMFALMAFSINTIRNRLMYEIIILASLASFGPSVVLIKYLRYFLLAMGLVFFTVSLTKQTSFVYVPYQNYLWSKINGYQSDGLERQDELFRIIRQGR